MDKNLIAIYSRKSKYTGKGESIENQIEMCKTFIINKYGSSIINNIVVFEDEGFTGSNTNRPNLQKMLLEFKKGIYKTLVVYRLDRISRNVLDFCELKDLLNNLKIDFISITENFDTSTPMGVAMLMITSVFAQLERDTIAERIRDNMSELAKTGRWLGGTTPLGYQSKKVEFITLDNKKRSLYQLIFNSKEITKVKLIFTKYLEFNSLSKLESYLIKNNIKTRRNLYFSRFALSNILKNITYCKADIDIKHFLENMHIEIYDNNLEFNGKYGLISYNKRCEHQTISNKIRNDIIKNIKEWIIAIGKHQGIIDGKQWIQIWQRLENKHYYKRNKKKNGQIEALLSGILKCQQCGSYMRPKILKTINIDGQRNFMYICELKSKSRKHLCNTKNIKGNDLDKQITTYLKTMNTDNYEIISILKKNIPSKNNTNEKQVLLTILNNNSYKINNLLAKLAMADMEVTPLIINQIKQLKRENIHIKKQLTKTYNPINLNKIDTSIFNYYNETFDKLNLDLKRDIIKALVISIQYDGSNIYLNL